jgi:hypothetical protein
MRKSRMVDNVSSEEDLLVASTWAAVIRHRYFRILLWRAQQYDSPNYANYDRARNDIPHKE